jgi:hypothetical protein
VKKHYKSLIVFLLFSAISFAQIPSYVPTNGLVGWWPFNGNANDESGNGNNGTVLTGVSLVDDRNGLAAAAYNVDGVSCVNKRGIEIPVMINQGNNYSISVWFKIIDVNQGFQTLFCSNPHNTVSVGFNHPFGPGVLQSGIGDGTNWIYTGQTGNSFSCSNYSNWNHLVVVKFPNEIHYYINSFLIRVQPNTNNPNVSFSLDFGTINFSAWGCFETLNGSLDDIGIWNRALTVCEIQNLYASQVLNANINAGPDQTICRGNLVTLQGAGGSSLAWDNGVIDGVPFEPAQSGAYVLTGADSLGCIGTDTVQITVLENASSTINQTAIDSYTLNGQVFTVSGTYTQTLIAANGCDSVITLNLELDFTGIQSHTNTSLQLYPNPVKDVMTLVGLKGEAVSFAVYSVDGKLIKSGQTSGEIELEDLKKGNYILKIENEVLPFVKL